MPLARRAVWAGLTLALTAAAPARAADDPAAATVRALYARFAATVKDGPGTLVQRVEGAGPAIEAAFDFPAMTRIAVGAPWDGYSEAQRAALTQAFGRNFVVTYANRLAQAAGGRFDIEPESAPRGAERVVSTKVTTPDGDDSDVDFVLNAGNLVQDVLLNGNVSEMGAQRTALSGPLKAGGADAGVAFLQQRTSGMLAAKPAP